jgi:hypothetical protein
LKENTKSTGFLEAFKIKKKPKKSFFEKSILEFKTKFVWQAVGGAYSFFTINKFLLPIHHKSKGPKFNLCAPKLLVLKRFLSQVICYCWFNFDFVKNNHAYCIHEYVLLWG